MGGLGEEAAVQNESSESTCSIFMFWSGERGRSSKLVDGDTTLQRWELQLSDLSDDGDCRNVNFVCLASFSDSRSHLLLILVCHTGIDACSWVY